MSPLRAEPREPAPWLFRPSSPVRYSLETLGSQPAGEPYTTVALQDYSNCFAAHRGRQAVAKALPKRNARARRILFPPNFMVSRSAKPPRR